jgi:hypothetical protein
MPKENIHQGSLAGTVFAQEGMNLSLLQLQRYVVVGHNSGKGFGNMFHLKNGKVFQGNHSSERK